MSKKKASGSTMTLKDFHGGSIPSDLPLPSAPGVVVRPSDRSGFDRSSSWINPTGRSDHRSRPHTSPATRHFDDKAPFLSHTAHIGRNFDEDERKPLDGVSAPRRTISDESIRAIPTRAELKPESSPSGGFRGRQGWTPASLSPSGSVNSYAGRVNEANHGGLNSLNLDGNVGQGVAGAYPNAWAARKEAAGVAADQLQSAWSAPNAVSKLAHASALEKVSSGRWQSKHSGHYQADVEVMRSSETESGLHTKSYANSTYNRLEVTGGREYYDATLSRHAERGLTIDGNIQGVRKELPDYERARALASSELKERDLTNFNDRRQPDHADGKFGGPESPSSTLSESLARPKLKLLPRTKLVESLEPPVVDQAQAYQQASESGRTEHFNDLYGNLSPAKSGTSSTENEKQAVERPKLNLKPRSQPLEQLEGKVERDRNTVFGGARPRELVLKERGIDDVGITHDLVQHSEKVEHHSPRTERVPGHANASRHSEKTENHHLDQRIGKKTERRDHRVDVDKVDMQKRNWRNENRRTHRDTERQQHQQPDRPPSPETWRKPIEQPKPSSADGASLRHGKAASAVELAQAFSRSVSDSNMDRFSGQKGIPGGGQLPFSRLMGTTSRPQINGY